MISYSYLILYCILYRLSFTLFSFNITLTYSANNFGILCSRKRISQNLPPNFIYIFQSHSWYSVRNYVIPEGIMKTRFEPRPPGMSSWKNNELHTLDFNTGPLHRKQVFCHWTIKARYIMSPQSCPCQDPSWGSKSAKPVKVTGKNDSHGIKK